MTALESAGSNKEEKCVISKFCKQVGCSGSWRTIGSVAFALASGICLTGLSVNAFAQGVDTPASHVGSTADRPLITVQGSGLTQRTVVARAVADAPSLRAREAERVAAEARVDQAIAAFLPRLKVSGTYRRVSPLEVTLGDYAIVGAKNAGPLFVGPSVGGSNLIVDSAGQPIGAKNFKIHSIENQFELKAELGIPISDLILRMKRTVGSAKSATAASRLMQEAERQKVAFDASIAYYNFIRAESSVQLSKQSLERTRALFADAQATTRAGVTTQTDVLRVDALVASTEVAVAEAERMQGLTKRQLQILLNDDRLEPKAGEDITSDVPSSGVLSVEEATRRALTNRAELRALREVLRAIEQRHWSYQVARFPRLDGFGQAIEGRPNVSVFLPEEKWRVTWAVGVTLSYSPNDTINNGAIAAEARAEHDRVQAELESADRNVKLQTASAALDMEKARTQIGAAVRGQQAAHDAHQSAQRLYRAGEATTTDLLDAETRLLAAELQLTFARLDLVTAQVRMAYATGEDLTRS